VQGIHFEAAEGIRTHDLLHGNYAGLRKPRGSNVAACRVSHRRSEPPRSAYARMCSDMRRFGNFDGEVPEIERAGLIGPRWANARSFLAMGTQPA